MSDIELYATEHGSGMPLVLLHGNNEDSTYFKHQIPCFSDRYRVITVDTRGHGKSPRGTKPFTLEQFAEDLKDFLDSRGLTKVYLLGFSDGGNIALLFALKYPEYVEKLILNGANLCPSGVKAAVQIPDNLKYLALSVRGIFDKTVTHEREMLNLMVTQPDIHRGRLMALTMPVLVIAGTDDMIKQSHTEAIARAVKYGELCIVEGDHFIAAGNPQVFNKKIVEFLDKPLPEDSGL